jgi:hypothetical protein
MKTSTSLFKIRARKWSHFYPELQTRYSCIDCQLNLIGLHRRQLTYFLPSFARKADLQSQSDGLYYAPHFLAILLG